jgi:hypothetical protein
MPHVFNGFIDVSSTLDALALFFARLLLGSPCDLAISEVIEPLEKQDPEVDTQRQFSAKPPFALGCGAFQIRKYHIRQGLPRDDVSQLDQRMGG